MAHNDWLPTRREEQLSMAKKWFEVLIGSGIPPKWGITEGQIGALGQIIQNIDSAEMQSRETGGGTVIEGRLRDLFTELVTLMRTMHRMITCSKALRTFELGVCDKRKLHTYIRRPLAEYAGRRRPGARCGV
jgi:uncharacterized protein YqgV (UPF0045/DUF77 family)